MGKSYSPVKLFSDLIKIDAHSASKVEDLGVISIRDFANCAPVSLEICLETNELLVHKGSPGTPGYEFAEGPEYISEADRDADYLGEKKAALADD